MIFKTLLGISVSLSPIMIIFLLFEKKANDRYSPKLFLGILTVLIVRLLVPYNLDLPTRVNIPISESVVDIKTESPILSQSFGEVIVPDELVIPMAADKETVILSWASMLAIIWVGGVAVLVGNKAVRYMASWVKIKRWSVPVAEQSYLDIVNSCRASLGIGRGIKVFRSDMVSSPLLIGIVSPRIILPSKDISAEHLQAIIYHELWHYKRGDICLKLLSLLATSIHWFNPFVHLVDRAMDESIELCCDYDLLSKTPGITPTEYGLAIISFANNENRGALSLSTAFSSNNQKTKERIMKIADHKKRKRGISLLVLGIVTTVIGGTLIGCSVAKELPVLEKPVSVNPISTDEGQDQAVPETPEAKSQADTGRIELIYPVPGFYDITTGLGAYPGHAGIDFTGDNIADSTVVAAADGTVTNVVEGYTGYGNYVTISHGDRFTTLYAHMATTTVKVGDEVSAGDAVGTVGITGNSAEYHLHLELKDYGRIVDPTDYFVAADTTQLGTTSNLEQYATENLVEFQQKQTQAQEYMSDLIKTLAPPSSTKFSSAAMIWPLPGGDKIESGYGWRFDGKDFHTGIDISGEDVEGKAVVAALEGEVLCVNWATDDSFDYGQFVIVGHGNDLYTIYANLGEISVQLGDKLAAGQAIGTVGNSGSGLMPLHLHFEVREAGKHADPFKYVGA